MTVLRLPQPQNMLLKQHVRRWGVSSPPLCVVPEGPEEIAYRSLRFISMLPEEERVQYPPLEDGILSIPVPDLQASSEVVSARYAGCPPPTGPNKPIERRVKFGFASVPLHI